jgi:proline- and glutamine-rich splicing factor
MGPRIANEGSFEHEYGSKWKTLVLEFRQKEKALKEELTREVEKLQTQMEMARYDYETEMLRQRKSQQIILDESSGYFNC